MQAAAAASQPMEDDGRPEVDNTDLYKKQREILNIDFNIPIRFGSIQTNDGKIFITGGAKSQNQSSNHAFELKDNVLI